MVVLVLQLALIASIDFAEQLNLFIRLATARRFNGESIKFRLFCRSVYTKQNNLLGRFGIVFKIELKCVRMRETERKRENSYAHIHLHFHIEYEIFGKMNGMRNIWYIV